MQPKGRMLRDENRQFVADLIKDMPLRQDLLIEYLHRIQDACGHVHADNICALADIMKLSQVEIYEVASFYDHFDVVKEGASPPPPLTIRICTSLSCMLQGAEQLRAEVSAKLAGAQVRVVPAPCMGGCDCAPAVRVGNREVGHATCEKIADLVTQGATTT
ncbi:MAG: NAD(P)H-dependent oxidoreductase subunit E, partial [Pseudomonadota bacterium]